MTASEGSRVTIRQVTYQGWQAYSIENGPLELVLVPQIGGRVMGMQWRGHDLSFTQPERRGLLEPVAAAPDVRARKREMGFPLWGGEKTWLAPQPRWNDALPFLDLDSGVYAMAVEEEGPRRVVVRMTSPVCRETGMQITRTVTVAAASTEWTVVHRILNSSRTEAEWGIWDVSMMLRPARVYLPRHAGSTYPEGIKTFPEEGDSVGLRDSVLRVWPDLAVVSCEKQVKFKYGVDADGQGGDVKGSGWILGILDVSGLGLVGYRKQVPLFVGQAYGHGCVAEVFNSDAYPYFEMETHGPVVRLKPDESFELEERHAIFEVAKWPENDREVLQLASARLC